VTSSLLMDSKHFVCMCRRGLRLRQCGVGEMARTSGWRANPTDFGARVDDMVVVSG
jgi:hypothetical protein